MACETEAQTRGGGARWRGGLNASPCSHGARRRQAKGMRSRAGGAAPPRAPCWPERTPRRGGEPVHVASSCATACRTLPPGPQREYGRRHGPPSRPGPGACLQGHRGWGGSPASRPRIHATGAARLQGGAARPESSPRRPGRLVGASRRIAGWPTGESRPGTSRCLGRAESRPAIGPRNACRPGRS